jgi:hypothetical protein
MNGIHAFLLGAGSICSLYPVLDIPKNPVRFFRSDEQALRHDWCAIGSDLDSAIRIARKSLNEPAE